MLGLLGGKDAITRECRTGGCLVGGQIISMKIGASITFTANEFSPKPAKSSHQRIVLHALSFLSP
jgi:hypothetical protein